MAPKLLPTYRHRVENWVIAIAPLFLRLMLLKHFPNQLKSLSNLTFSQIFWLFNFLFRVILAQSRFWCCQRCEFFRSMICDLRSLMNKSMQFLWPSFETFSNFIVLVKNLLKSGQGPRQETSSYQIWQIALW